MVKVRVSRVWICFLALAGAASCGDDSGNLVDGFTMAEWAQLRTLSPLPATCPPETTNAFADNPMAAVLGQKFFYDKRVSGPIITGNNGTNGGFGAVGEVNKIACAGCHQGPWMIDQHTNDGTSNPNAVVLGADWTSRNAGSPINGCHYCEPGNCWFENDGLRDRAWGDSLTDPEYPPSQNGSRLRVAHLMWDHYKTEYNALFTQTPLDPRLDPASPMASAFPPDGKPGVADYDNMAMADKMITMTIFANFGKAVQAYLRKLSSRNAPFDQYVAGTYTAISPAAKRGLKLFLGKANCIGCHTGPLLSDSKFHNLGMVAKGPHALPEDGRYTALMCLLTMDEFTVDSPFSDDRNTHQLDGVVPDTSDKGKWRTHGLRQVALTGPWTHTGQFATLKELVHFYNLGGDMMGFIGTKDMLMKPLNLTDAEENDIVEFMKTLTGDQVPQELRTDTSNP